MKSLIQDKKLKALLKKIPALANAGSVTVLGGGLTNLNYRVETPTGIYVMRWSGDTTALLGINRENERGNTIKAFEAGVGAAVIDALPEENVLVISWIEAQTLHTGDFQSKPALIPRVAQALKKLHAGPAFQGDFHFPSIRKKYLQTVLNNHYFLPHLYLTMEPAIIELEKILASDPEVPVPCNNDLLAENFMDDGKKIWIIDYEYAGQNEASFEIGNLASEIGLSAQQLVTLCDTYWGQHRPSKIARAMAWAMIARYGWVMWASIQEAVSNIDFDFRAWGARKWNSVLPDLQGSQYENLIKTLKASTHE
ncbi:MAG TPA: choline/ethanolamine kinase family protein [Agriterribacter sp.]|nr:choline/ethanolamine kinase family protein [Agriterribacter sp.]